MRWIINALAGLALVATPLTGCRDDAYDSEGAIERYEERAPLPAMEPADPVPEPGEPAAVSPAEGQWITERDQLQDQMKQKRDTFSHERSQLESRIGVNASEEILDAEKSLTEAVTEFEQKMSEMTGVERGDFEDVRTELQRAAQEVEQRLTELRQRLETVGADRGTMQEGESHEGMPEKGITPSPEPSPTEPLIPPAPQPRPME